MDFQTLHTEAQKVLLENKYNVVTAFLTDKNNIHVINCGAFDNCCNKTGGDYSLDVLLTLKETRILKMITVYKQNGKTGNEAPCAWLRKAVCDMNNNNAGTEIQMMNGRICKLSELFPANPQQEETYGKTVV